MSQDSVAVARYMSEYVAFCKREYGEWSESNPLPRIALFPWNVSAFFDAYEARSRLWDAHITRVSTVWWLSRGVSYSKICANRPLKVCAPESIV